jgi:hypothetical protein
MFRLTPRLFHSTRLLSKKISNIKLDELVEQTGIKKERSLHLKQVSSGSVVIDTVREYTKQYPLCVLLVQVGDFYEVILMLAVRYKQINTGQKVFVIFLFYTSICIYF